MVPKEVMEVNYKWSLKRSWQFIIYYHTVSPQTTVIPYIKYESPKGDQTLRRSEPKIDSDCISTPRLYSHDTCDVTYHRYDDNTSAL